MKIGDLVEKIEITNEMQVEYMRRERERNCANASSSHSCTSFHAAA